MIWDGFLQLAAACFGTIAFSIMFYVPKEYYPACGVIGGIGWLVCWGVQQYLGWPNFTATLLAAALVILMSRVSGVVLKCPSTLFLMSGIFPLVPGIGIYRTVYALIEGKNIEVSAYGRQTIGAAIAIVLGIVIVYEIPQKGIAKLAAPFRSLREHWQQKKSTDSSL